MRSSDAPADRRLRLRVTPFSVVSVALVLLLAASQLVVTDHFFQRSSLSVLTPLIGILVIAAIGQAFVIGTGGIDLSVAATITLVGSILLKQTGSQNGKLGGALVLCVVACVLIGLINGLLVEALRLNALVVTLAVGELVTGYTHLYQGEVPSTTSVPSDLSRFAGSGVGGVSWILLISVCLAIVGSYFLHRIVPGRRLVASSASPATASLVGLKAGAYRVLAYVLASVCYGFAGILAAGQIGTPDLTLGTPYLLTSIVAVVLGGATLTGGRISLLATFVGAAFVTILDFDLQVAGRSAGVQMLIQGVVLVLALSLSYGLRHLGGLAGLVRRRRVSTASGSQPL
jgi:ribose transport system permease protein